MPPMSTWFATSCVGPDHINNPGWGERPEATMLHAKRIGTSLTACGRDTLNWYKHWAPFDPGRTRNACCECLRVFTGATRT
jgi:hypothetical protein